MLSIDLPDLPKSCKEVQDDYTSNVELQQVMQLFYVLSYRNLTNTWAFRHNISLILVCQYGLEIYH